MSIRLVLNPLIRVLVPLALLSTIYLYLYPIFHGCAFPSTNGSIISSFRDTAVKHAHINTERELSRRESLAPFRLLVLADPQLEGDSSLPKPEDALLQRLKSHWRDVQDGDASRLHIILYDTLTEVFVKDIPQSFQALRKRIDLFGNDYYLAHIFRALNWWAKPTHLTVLGDLIGSQWVNDEEFDWRGWRFWNRVFKGGERIDDGVTQSTGEVMRMDDEAWKNRIVNIAGNHDIGYAGDVSRKRMDRFEHVFGKANWDVRFEYPTYNNGTDMDTVRPTLHLVVLNSLVLDTPALDDEIQAETYSYLNDIITKRSRPVEDRSSFTLMLTHLPLYKEKGVCVDGPFWDFWGNDDGGGVYKTGGLKEQNHLSKPVSEPGMLEALFGMKGDLNVPAQGKGRNGLVLTGHDHEGCDTWHYIPVNSTWMEPMNQDEEMITQWETVRWKDAERAASHTGVREVTLRSMMGEFGGNAGLLSAWFDFDAGEWKYEIQTCKIGVQHIWWAVHVVDVVAVVLTLVSMTMAIFEQVRPVTVTEVKLKGKNTKSKG